MKPRPIEAVPDSVNGSGGVNRLYAVLYKVNEAMVRIREPQKLYEEACRIAVEDGRFLLAWIGFVEPDSECIRPGARFGRDDGYLDTIKLSLRDDVSEGQGPTGVALREGRAFINNDTENNPIMRPWRDEQLKRGFRSSASFPLSVDGKTVGVITLYAGEAGFFDEEEIRLLTALAEDFSFALESAATKEASSQLETATLLLEAAEQLNKWTDLPGLLEALVGMLLRILPGGRVNIGIATDDHSAMTMAAGGGRRPFPVGGIVPWDRLTSGARNALETGDTSIVDFELLDEGGIANEYGSRLALFVGLKFGERVLGQVGLDVPGERHDFSAGEIALVESIASQAAVAIENARLYESEHRAWQQAAQELATTTFLLEAAYELNKGLDLESLLLRLTEVAVRATRHTRVHAALLSDDLTYVTFVASVGDGRIPSGTVVQVDQLSGPTREALATGRTTVADVETLPEGKRGRFTETAAGRFGLVVPIVLEGRVLGHIAIDSPGERIEFAEREIAVFEAIAAQVAVAIERARLFDNQRQQAERASVLKELAEIGVTGFGVNDVAERFAQAIIGLLGASNAAIVLSDGVRLRPVALVGYPDDYVEKLDPMPDDALAAQAFRSGQARFITDVKAAEISDFTRTVSTALGFSSFAALPLGPSEAPIGAVGFVWQEVRRFDADEVAFLHSVVAEAALAIENARLFESERESARLSGALNEVNRAVHSTLEIDEVLQHALDAGVLALGCDSGAIEMREADGWVVRYQKGFSARDVGLHFSETDAPNATQAALRGAPLQIEDMSSTSDGINVGFVKKYGLRSVLAIPMFARGAVVGAGLFYTSKNARRFTDAEVDFGRKLGAVVSLGIENARLYAAERNTAQTLQRALLTLPDSIRDVDFASSYRSATESTLVGGDFYDIFELDDDRIGITIGDISGKGLSAAVLTSLVKDTIRAHANERAKTPGRILTLTNELVYRSTPTDVFATVFFGILDRSNGRLSFASAGHTTAAVLKLGCDLVTLPCRDPILGAFAHIEFGESQAHVGPDETLFLYTDGLTEARQGRELYGERRLFDLLSSSKGDRASDTVDRVRTDVLSFASGRLRDDLAILAVRRLETPPGQLADGAKAAS
jgi:GAF domain-containing protein